MSYAMVYANVSRRLKMLDEQVSVLEHKKLSNRQEWESVRRDLIAVTNIASNLESLSEQPSSAIIRNLSEQCAVLMNRVSAAENRYDQAARGEREQFLGTLKSRTNRSEISHNSNDQESTILSIDDANKRENYVYDFTKSQVRNYLDVGAQALDELRNQRSLLMVARKKLLNAIRSTGISNNLMYNIEKRYYENKIITVSGIIISIIIMIFVVKYLN